MPVVDDLLCSPFTGAQNFLRKYRNRVPLYKIRHSITTSRRKSDSSRSSKIRKNRKKDLKNRRNKENENTVEEEIKEK